MFCPKCGGSNQDGSKFCIYCGENFGERAAGFSAQPGEGSAGADAASVAQPAQPTAVQPAVPAGSQPAQPAPAAQPAASQPTDAQPAAPAPDAAQPAAPAPNPAQPAPKKNNRGLVIGIVAAVAVVAVVAALALFVVPKSPPASDEAVYLITNEQYEDSEYNVSSLRENEYDNRGGILSSHYESTSDDYSYISDTDYELDKNGFPVVQTNSWSDSSEDGGSQYDIENVFDEEGRLIRSFFASSQTYVSAYTYYENGAVKSLKHSSTDNSDYWSYYEYEWDEQGFLTYSHSSYESDGVNSKTYEWFEWELDENGLPIGVSIDKEDVFDSTDTDDWSYEWYDVETDEAGNIVSFSNDNTRIEYEYVKIENPNVAAQLRSNTVTYAI